MNKHAIIAAAKICEFNGEHPENYTTQKEFIEIIQTAIDSALADLVKSHAEEVATITKTSTGHLVMAEMRGGILKRIGDHCGVSYNEFVEESVQRVTQALSVLRAERDSLLKDKECTQKLLTDCHMIIRRDIEEGRKGEPIHEVDAEFLEELRAAIDAAKEATK